jgi:uncharacterized membrane protein
MHESLGGISGHQLVVGVKFKNLQQFPWTKIRLLVGFKFAHQLLHVTFEVVLLFVVPVIWKKSHRRQK